MSINRRLNNPFHLVENSPWPISISIILLTIVLSFVNKLYFIKYSEIIGKWTINDIIMIISFSMLLFNLFFWFKEIIEEGYYRGEHSEKVQQGLKIGFSLFVLSEALVFFCLFFAYFYNSLIPSIELGSIWSPVGITPLNYKAVPLLNTLILFFSGITITSSHNFLIANKKSLTIFYLSLTILLGIIFSVFQYYEYKNASFTITDSFYGSSFFILTRISCFTYNIWYFIFNFCFN